VTTVTEKCKSIGSICRSKW